MAAVIPKGFKAADNLLGSKRCETSHPLYLRGTRFTDFLSVPHPLARHISKHPILRVRLYRCNECGTDAMGPAHPEVIF